MSDVGERRRHGRMIWVVREVRVKVRERMSMKESSGRGLSKRGTRGKLGCASDARGHGHHACQTCLWKLDSVGNGIWRPRGILGALGRS